MPQFLSLIFEYIAPSKLSCHTYIEIRTQEAVLCQDRLISPPSSVFILTDSSFPESKIQLFHITFYQILLHTKHMLYYLPPMRLRIVMMVPYRHYHASTPISSSQVSKWSEIRDNIWRALCWLHLNYTHVPWMESPFSPAITGRHKNKVPFLRGSGWKCAWVSC